MLARLQRGQDQTVKRRLFTLVQDRETRETRVQVGEGGDAGVSVSLSASSMRDDIRCCAAISVQVGYLCRVSCVACQVSCAKLAVPLYQPIA